MSLEGTLALAIKNYRTVVDSRRFVPLASETEFKKIFDEVLIGLLENLSEAVKIQRPETFETSKVDNDDEVIEVDNELMEKTESFDTFIQVDAKKINVATDILKLLIILKHFINQPVYADEDLHEIFSLAARMDIKIVSGTADFDDQKAKKRFETFIGNLYVLLCEDSSLKSDAKGFFKNLTSARLHDVLLEAAPRASHEEMYRKHYRGLLVNISDVSELVAQVIKRLDSYYPEPQTIEGVSRKTFLLERLGWKNTTVLQCSIKLHQAILEACKQKNQEDAFKNVQYFWILLAECKFVAPDEFCATLFIFPSECESFLKMTEDLAECLAEIIKTFKNLDGKKVKILNEINKEISIWVQKLVKAVGTNYVHFERDLNNRTYRSSNKILSKIVASLSNTSKFINENISVKAKNNLELVQPVGEIKTVAEFMKKQNLVDDDVVNVKAEDENDFTVIPIPKSPYSPTSANSPANTSKSPKSFMIATGNANDLESKSKVSIWALLIAILSTIAAALCIKHFYDNSTKN